MEEFRAACRMGKINAVKFLRTNFRGLGLKDAKDTAELWGAKNPGEVAWFVEPEHAQLLGKPITVAGVISMSNTSNGNIVPQDETILSTRGTVMCYSVISREAWVTGPVSAEDMLGFALRIRLACRHYNVPLEEIVVQVSQ